jgi:hypothetical protein
LRIGVAAATKFKDMDQVRSRLEKSGDHTLVIRAKDRVLTKMLEDAPNVETWIPEYTWLPTNAKNEALLNDVDHMLVFHAPGATLTDFFVKRAREWPYDRIYGEKVTVVE